MKVSIITVVKNDKENISTTIDSVINQNYKNIEYIIIDGCSIDGTYEKIKSKIKKSKKKILLIKKKDKNMYEAINYGIRISKGKIFGLVHSGDILFDKNILKSITKNFKGNTNALSGNLIYKNKHGKINRLWNYSLKKLSLYNFYKIAHPTLFLKKKLFKKIGPYNISYDICSDTDFIIRLSMNKNTKFKYLNKIVTVMNNGGLSTSFKHLLKKVYEDLRILNKYFKILFIIIYLNKIFFKLFKFFNFKLNKKNYV